MLPAFLLLALLAIALTPLSLRGTTPARAQSHANATTREVLVADERAATCR